MDREDDHHRRPMRTPAPPPPVLHHCRLFKYAVRTPSVELRRRTNLFVDGVELGHVPRLAIGEYIDTSEVYLLYCDARWRPLGVAQYDSVAEASQKAERTYPGISKLWVPSRVSKRAARAYLRKLWSGDECSFCNRLPYQVESMIASRRARICNVCIQQLSHPR